MEENINKCVEQSESIVTDQSVSTQQENGVNVSNASDSTFGKFRDAKSLVDAYNNLQVAFTKKSQQLAELIKNGTNNEGVSSEIKTSEEKNIDTKNVDHTQLSPVYERSDWHEKLGSFLANHEQAKNYAKEIGAILLEDKALAKDPNSLELAWAKVMSRHYVAPDQLSGADIDKYLESHTDIKDKIISDYLNSIHTGKVVPLISESKGSNTSVLGRPKFSNLNEAKQYVEAMFRR